VSGLGSASQAVVNTGQAIGDDSRRHQILAPFTLSFADRLLTAREVAARLRVSTRTVYALCERGKLAHVRIMNAIRVEPAALAALIAVRGNAR
jgi:excisionase family DNA binding protein